MEDMVVRHRAHDGVVTETRQPGGGVFVPLKAQKITTPIYLYGVKGSERAIFTCPVSAIPWAVQELHAIWMMCRLVHALPHAGGLLDQPPLVQRGFPIFEDELAVMTARPAPSQ